MSHNHKRDKKKTLNSDNLDDIIAMSNDESIKKKRDRKDDTDDEMDDDDTDDDIDDDIDDTDDTDDTDDDTDEMNDSDKKKRRKIKKMNDETDDYSVPKIKAKKAKPHRQSEFTKEEISEIKKAKAVEELGNKLNNNLHQIQIALPYDQEPPRYVENNQQMIPKKKKPFWKRKQFKTTMKIIIYVCVFIIISAFIWKYIKAVKLINKRNDVFNENDDVNKGMNGGGDDNKDVLSDRVYGSIGSEKQIESKQKKVKNNVRNRDSRGRFIKKGK